MADEQLQRVYSAQTTDQQRNAYDAWANEYERDLCNMGYRIPGLVAGAFARFVVPGSVSQATARLGSVAARPASMAFA